MTAPFAAAIYGKTGTGKTTLARSFIGNAPRVVVFDPTRQWQSFPGFETVATLRDLTERLANNYASFRVAYSPPRGADTPAYLAKACEIIMHYQLEQNAREDFGGVMLVVEEMAASYSNAAQERSDLGVVKEMILQRRHANVAIVGVSQRPQNVGTNYRDNVDQTCSFALGSARAQAEVIDKVKTYGAQWPARLMALPRFHYLNVTDDSVTEEKTKPL